MKYIYLCWVICLLMSFPVLASDNIGVTVSRADDHSWVVDYKLPAAVTQVYFYREGSLPRDGWRMANDNLRIVQVDNEPHTIESINGASFQKLRIYFDSDFRTTPKDYELNFAFSDGGVLLYTGHLLLAMSKDVLVEHEFHFKPYKQNHMIVQGQVGTETHKWLDKELKGTYIYYGHNQPVKSKHMVAVLDSGLPPWIKSRLVIDLPKLFDFYAKKTGLTLDFVPVVYFGFVPQAKPGTQYSGGTLPGLIQLSVKGNDWHNESIDNLSGLLNFLAHEAAHLWNAQLVEITGENNASWIHEGGADAFAVRALVHLGIVQESEVISYHEKYLNACIESLKGHQVTAFEKHQDFGVFYHCGATIAWLTELAVKAKDGKADLFDFWADLLQRVNSKKLKLSTEQYIKSLVLMTHNSGNIVNILTLLDEPQKHPIKFFSESFSAVGMKATLIENHPRLAQKAMKTVLKHLMVNDCKGYSYQDHGSYFSVGKGLSCKSFKAGMKINQILDLDVKSKAHAIYAKVKAFCQIGTPIQVQTEQNQSIEIVCNEPIESLTPWLSLSQSIN